MAGEFVTIPVISDPKAYTFTVTLEGVDYIIGFTWNGRLLKWIMDISTAEGDPIVFGSVVNCGSSPLVRHKDERLPPGKIVFLDTTGKDIDPGIDDFGTRVLCMYEPSI